MTPFLKDLADTFYKHHHKELGSFCFVTPNKRSGTFLADYFTKAFEEGVTSSEEAFLMPEITTITDFVGNLSELVVNSRIDSLFSLYSIYSSREGVDIDFDRFRIWGEIALNDFNEVDMYCVDADKIFRNLRNYNEIATDYLTEEQREIVETYFPSGRNRPNGYSFWKHFNNESDTGRKYIQLWEIMHTLYHQLAANLEERGLCLSGRAYLRALKRIEKEGERCLPYKQVVFVGFNALTTVEYRIFKAVRQLTSELNGEKVSLGDFYWDAAGEVLGGTSSAAHFMNKNRKHFPSRYPLRRSNAVTGFPNLTKIIACPGNTIQTKVVSELLQEIQTNQPSLLQTARGLAVAMPDENLFFPMLYSLPSELKEVNITMGYPLKITSTYSWMRLFRVLHLHSRPEFDAQIFLRQDLLPFFVHPITRSLLGSHTCQWIVGNISTQRSFTVSSKDILSYMKGETIEREDKDEETKIREEKLKELQSNQPVNFAEALHLILLPLAGFKKTEDLCNHLLSIITLIQDNIRHKEASAEEIALIKDEVELHNLTVYADAVRRFMHSASMHGIEMTHVTAFTLINQLLAAERINFQGEPLSGVQVMGMLETRSLDFENVIITSMNERIFPRRLRNRSFIPNSLRYDYGMATTRFQESIFAYYFYRLISRAKNVYLLYDSRSSGVRSGDPSRYIYQLRYIYSGKAQIINQTRTVSVVSGTNRPIVAEKTPEVMEKLNRYLGEDTGSYLSASALKKYLSCPLQFYYHYIRGIKVQDEEVEGMSPAQLGDIYHYTMSELYGSELNKGAEHTIITTDIIDSWLEENADGDNLAGEVVKKYIRSVYEKSKDRSSELKGFAEVYFKPIYNYVKRTLLVDRQSAPFEFLGGEKEEIVSFPLNDGTDRTVRMKYVIDRIDKVNGKVRLIDYKTGGDATEFTSVSTVFQEEQAIFQLLLYASLYDIKENNSEPLKIGIAKPPELGIKKDNYDVLYQGLPLDNHLELKEEFEKKFRERLKALFDPKIPFEQTPGRDMRSKPCTYCSYKNICSLKESGNVLKNTR